jgi:4-hydroxybenzoate polyprenyltransferase
MNAYFKNIIILLRPHQWIKNVICFGGVLFGGHLLKTDYWHTAFFVFLFFSFASSGIYVINDIIDKERDKLHHKKNSRPIASGKIPVFDGVTLSIFLITTGILGSMMISINFLMILSLYIINNIFYSNFFKNIPIIDVFSIAFGFNLRLVSGIIVFGDLPTAWIIICTMFMSLFLGFSKRRAELVSYKKNDSDKFFQRPVLKYYQENFLNSLINETSFGAVITYALFCTTSGKNPTLIITIPIVYYAILYYKIKLFKNSHGEEPDSIIYNDIIIILSIFIWLTTYLCIEYFEIQIFL